MHLSYPKEKIKILLLEGIHPRAETHLHSMGYTVVQTEDVALEGDALKEAVADAHMLGIRSRTLLTEDVLDAAKKLMAVGCFCIGTNQVDLKAAQVRGIPVFNAPHSNTRSVAEMVIGLTVMLYRGIFAKNQAAHEGKWLKVAKGSHEVRGKTLGIVGYGHIGSQVSVLAESMGMRVLYYDVLAKLPLGNAQTVHSLEELLQKSDVVSLHVPDTPLTRLMMDEHRLQLMKPGAFLINYSRGTVVDIEALKSALDTGHIGGAAIDVFPSEPKNKSESFQSPLQGMPNVVLSPHIGGSTEEAQENIAIEVSQKLAFFSDRGSTEGVTNFPELSLAPHEDAHRILHIHKNAPGALKRINETIAEEGLNIVGQYLNTKDEVGYVVVDIENGASMDILDKLKAIDGTIRARVLY